MCYSNGSNNSGDIIIAVRCIFLRKLKAVHGIIASVVQIITYINSGGTSKLQNNCGASYVVGHQDYKTIYGAVHLMR